MRRHTFERVRAWHGSIRDAREIDLGGVWTAAEFLALWGRGARRILAPRCVYRRRYERSRRGFAELTAYWASLPPPKPPEGKTWAFSNGTEYDCWTAHNCDGCALAGDPSVAGSSSCAIFEAIHDAAGDDGTVTLDIAERMGMSANKGYLYWRCPEFIAAAGA